MKLVQASPEIKSNYDEPDSRIQDTPSLLSLVSEYFEVILRSLELGAPAYA